MGAKRAGDRGDESTGSNLSHLMLLRRQLRRVPAGVRLLLLLLCGGGGRGLRRQQRAERKGCRGAQLRVGCVQKRLQQPRQVLDHGGVRQLHQIQHTLREGQDVAFPSSEFCGASGDCSSRGRSSIMLVSASCSAEVPKVNLE